MCDFPSLLGQLRNTFLQHQFQTWIHLNEAQPIRDHKPSYARPRRPTQHSSLLKAQPKIQHKKKRKRRSKEDNWNRHREFWKRSKSFFTTQPPPRCGNPIKRYGGM
jgi:hypothetical protein